MDVIWGIGISIGITSSGFVWGCCFWSLGGWVFGYGQLAVSTGMGMKTDGCEH